MGTVNIRGHSATEWTSHVYFSLFFDFHNQILREPAGIECVGNVGGGGSRMDSRERAWLVMADGGGRGPNEVWVVQWSGSPCQVLTKFCPHEGSPILSPNQGCLGTLFINWTIIILLSAIEHYLTLDPAFGVEEFMAKNIKIRLSKTGKFIGTFNTE